MPMPVNRFLRNSRAGELLEVFLISAVSGLLFVRLYLSVTGFPQIGHGQLHIAHMLFGGILMLTAIVMMLAFLGSRVQRLSALIGGLGFGVFIDELGKFITKDNNYFFQPTIAIIYVIFVALFLAFRTLGRHRVLTSKEYLLNALIQLEEAVLQDMDQIEKKRVQRLLHQADQADRLTRQLTGLVDSIKPIPEAKLSRFASFRLRSVEIYQKLVLNPRIIRRITVFFLLDAAYYVGWVVVAVLTHQVNDEHIPLLLQLGSSLIAAFIIVTGAFVLRRNRLQAYELFQRAVLVNLFLTQFFSFYREELDALPGFILNLIVFLVIQYAIRQERLADKT